MTDGIRPEDFNDIRNLYGRYALSLDSGNVDAFVDCFLADGTWAFHGIDGIDRDDSFVGRQRLSTLAQDIFAGTQCHVLHVFHFVSIEVGDDSARVSAYGYATRRGQTPYAGLLLTGVEHDQLARTAQGWRFRSRIGHIDSHAAGSSSRDDLVRSRDEFVEAIAIL